MGASRTSTVDFSREKDFSLVVYKESTNFRDAHTRKV